MNDYLPIADNGVIGDLHPVGLDQQVDDERAAGLPLAVPAVGSNG